MPTSLRKAVPPGRMRASAVCTCVCVPITAVTRPSRNHARAAFSLVASAWMSTMTHLQVIGICVRICSAVSNGQYALSFMNTLPTSEITATSPPAGLRVYSQPRPGWSLLMFAGRTTFFMPRISSSNSLRSHVWSPDVKTSTTSSISPRQVLFIPAPAAQFSPFAMTNVHIYCCFSCGTSALTALRPPLPTISPMNSKLSVGPFKFILLDFSRFDLKNE